MPSRKFVTLTGLSASMLSALRDSRRAAAYPIYGVLSKPFQDLRPNAPGFRPAVDARLAFYGALCIAPFMVLASGGGQGDSALVEALFVADVFQSQAQF